MDWGLSFEECRSFPLQGYFKQRLNLMRSQLAQQSIRIGLGIWDWNGHLESIVVTGVRKVKIIGQRKAFGPQNIQMGQAQWCIAVIPTTRKRR